MGEPGVLQVIATGRLRRIGVSVVLAIVGSHLSGRPLVADGTRTGEPGGALDGATACWECHEAQDRAHAGARHGLASDRRTPEAKGLAGGSTGCRYCHASPLFAKEQASRCSEGVFVPLGRTSPVRAERRNALCLECHRSGRQAAWAGSTHERRGVACADCHRTHGGEVDALAGPDQTEVCARCHPGIRAKIRSVSHHPLREGRMKCSDCHNPHGGMGEGSVDALSISETCFECHADKRGPYLWEHAAVVESCLSCHTPHGSSHPDLLKARMPYLCQRCHSDSRHPGTLYAIPSTSPSLSPYATLPNRAFYRACLNCHVAVHGSNHPSGKGLVR